MHRGPQAHAQPFALQSAAGPNAALLIDFDNVTLGIQKDLGKELRNLLGSDIIKGKVSVQRAYADWRRYPQYIVPLAESSIDMIFAPAYGSAKKNATDIRLAIDAIELVFTRPEIGTFILLSGDSDFSSLVLKLKEYGKYVIGVGIRESASDLLVQNCDEYYSYNALAGLSKSADEAPVKRDPWELVAEAIGKMKRQGDVMRSDRLKQVMQDLDPSFDEKDLGYSKFSRFVTEAAAKGLVVLTKLENGQLEVSPPGGEPAVATPQAEGREPREEREERDGRGRRGRRGRGRGRDRDDRPARADAGESDASADQPSAEPSVVAVPMALSTPSDDIGLSGERLTRDEALALVRRAVEALVSGDDAVSSEMVRRKARELHGRDSESLALRFFDRILKDAHTGGHIDLRRRGDAFEIARIAESAVADQLAAAAVANTPVAPVVPSAPRGLGPRGIPSAKGKKGAPPPDLLLIGVVEEAAPAAAAVTAVVDDEAPAPKTRKGRAPATEKSKAAKPKAEKSKAETAKAEKPAKAAADKKPRARGKKVAAE
ncbi:MAG: NYN domain-containing protein [Gemmatimonadaceae bacterium]|nr:NYN domain-containing protein [Gemmatimonadaceae bacterium]